ncbi:hypothetical protein HHL23_20465 [Chryseobacterium sp. RP-3-3]|uniref:Uncharacterized protein n=1 Tax=Chryseobacterium antibioticum TaxID=2728847 RepID=A0A7Y0ARJ7_9FLAO|nr:hypothetical protein [Chryseobacterium antibioticum]NML72143.1 hypothetical protein [Chryseobacterium antibioticum]
MGTLNKLLILILLLNIAFLYSQSCIIKVNKSDSIKLEKQDNEYYKEYVLSIYNPNFNTNEIVKNYKVSPIKKTIKKNDQIYNLTKTSENKLKKKCFSKDLLFLIESKFYKHIKTF